MEGSTQQCIPSDLRARSQTQHVSSDHLGSICLLSLGHNWDHALYPSLGQRGWQTCKDQCIGHGSWNNARMGDWCRKHLGPLSHREWEEKHRGSLHVSPTSWTLRSCGTSFQAYRHTDMWGVFFILFLGLSCQATLGYESLQMVLRG